MKYLKLFDAFNIVSIPTEESDFLKRIKAKYPDLYNRYYSLVKNRGLEKAKEIYLGQDEEYRKEKDKEKKLLRKKTHTNGIQEELRIIIPRKKAIKELFKEHIFTTKFKELYKQLGFQLPDYFVLCDNLQYDCKVKTYDAKIQATLFHNERINNLGGLIKLINRIGNIELNEPFTKLPKQPIIKGPMDTSTPAEKELNKFQTVELFDTTFWIELKLHIGTFENYYASLTFTIGHDQVTYSSYKMNRDMDNRLIECELDNNVKIEIPKLFDREGNTNDLLGLSNKLSKLTENIFVRLERDINTDTKEALNKVKAFEDKCVKIVVETLHKHENNMFKNLDIIKKNFPYVYSKIKPLIGEQESEIGSSLGELGF